MTGTLIGVLKARKLKRFSAVFKEISFVLLVMKSGMKFLFGFLYFYLSDKELIHEKAVLLGNYCLSIIL